MACCSRGKFWRNTHRVNCFKDSGDSKWSQSENILRKQRISKAILTKYAHILHAHFFLNFFYTYIYLYIYKFAHAKRICNLETFQVMFWNIFFCVLAWTHFSATPLNLLNGKYSLTHSLTHSWGPVYVTDSQNLLYIAKFEVLRSELLQSLDFWDVSRCWWAKPPTFPSDRGSFIFRVKESKKCS